MSKRIWMLGITIYNMINGEKSISDFKTLEKMQNIEITKPKEITTKIWLT